MSSRRQSPNRSLDNPVPIYRSEDFVGLRRAGQLAAQILDSITPYVIPGVSTGELDRICHNLIADHGAMPAPLNYRGYPKSICTSVNHVVCHGIPSDKRYLNDGDIINIDVTVILDGWHGDTSRMFTVGNVGFKAHKLCNVTYHALMRGLAVIQPGITLGDLGYVIQVYVEKQGFSVVRDFCGHGIGRRFHEAPAVLHFGTPGTGLVIETGMVFTVEPMVNIGKPDVHLLQDGWTAVTRDRTLSAQYEHMIGVLPDGIEIFTLSPERHSVMKNILL